MIRKAAHFKITLGGHAELSSFSRANTEYAGEGGSMGRYTLGSGSLTNQHFQSTLLGGREGVTKKNTLCTLLIMWIIVGDPLVFLDNMDQYVLCCC